MVFSLFFFFLHGFQDKGAFFKDYAKSHKKFSELGFHPDLHAEAQHPPAEAKPPVAKL